MPLDDLERAHYEQALLELRTLQRVAEELSRSLDLEVVSARCLDLAVEAAPAAAGAIYLADPARGLFRRVVERHLTDEVAPPLLPAPDLIRVLRSSSLQVEVTAADSNPMVQAAWRRGIRRVILLPLRLEDELLGFVSVHLTESRELAASTMKTLEAIARHESAAIANARAHQTVGRRGQMTERLLRLSERVIACADQQELCRMLLEAAIELTGSNGGLLSQIEGEELLVAIGFGTDNLLTGTRYPLDLPYLREALARPGTTAYEDIERFAPDSVVGKLLRQRGISSFMVATIRHGGETIGTLSVSSSEPRHYEPEERDGLQILSAIAAEALERVRALDRLAAEKRRLDEVLEHLPVGVSVIGPTGEALHVNAAARAFGEWIGGGGDWRAMVSRIQTFTRDGQLVPRENLMVVKAFRGETSPPTEMTVIASDGKSKRHMLAMAGPLRGPDGRVEAVVSSQQDVTALRELADAKDHFLRIASHELRSPLTSLRATTSLLEMDPSAIEDPERRATLLDRVQRQTARLTRLVEQLIDSVRLNATEPPLERVETDLVTLCREVIEALPDEARVQLDAKWPVVGKWDGARLEQVLSNLISNALRYSEQPITVRVRAHQRRAIVEVIDRGIGIPEEVRGRLFTPFFRAPNAMATSKGGLGLGLHIAHEIVRRHGGTLTVQSRLGEGSTFIVDLPVDTTAPKG
jgi:nitrogen-specific signal transduction histidine kinase